MRSIKYKAWDKVTKKMYQVQEMELWETCRHVVVEDYEYALVDPVLLQYTGLKDKNGKEIYEGDILSYKAIVYTDCSKTDIEKIYDEALMGIITHSDIATVVKPYTKNVPAFGHDSENNTKLILDLNSNEIEIIGNIYENKELLEDDHNE